MYKVRMTLQDIQALLARRSAGSGGQKALADKLRISSAYLGDIINDKRKPGPKVLAVLGLERVVVYRKIKQE